MPTNNSINNSLEHKAYIITGPTSGIGRRTALDAAKYGTVLLVGALLFLPAAVLGPVAEHLGPIPFGG